MPMLAPRFPAYTDRKPQLAACAGLIAALAILFTGCGGGGSAGSGDNPTIAVAPVLESFAGNTGGPGNLDGTGTAAGFNFPFGVATDRAGNVYVADALNNTIRKIAATGVVTTLAGTAGVIGIGSADGTGPAARFWGPQGVATDSSDNVYVADTGNKTIRKITPTGVVTTIAGKAGGLFGSADGVGTAASFAVPVGVAVDGANNIYVADSYNQNIRKISPAGGVTTLAGTLEVRGAANGAGTTATFSGPSSLAFDSAGNLYVADFYNHLIRKITPVGIVSTLAGTAGVSGSADGQGATAMFDYPAGVAADGAGNVYVSETGNRTIRKITPAGLVSTLAGTSKVSGYADGAGVAASFFSPASLAVDNAGSIYVADVTNNNIRKITQGGVVTTVAGTSDIRGSADGAGTSASFFFSTSNAGMPTPFGGGITVDGEGNVYVADTWNNSIRKITPAGVVSTIAGAAADLKIPKSSVSDSAGSIFEADTKNHTIRKTTADGVVTTLAGTGRPGFADGTGTAAIFNSPLGLVVDTLGNVYVADMMNNAIRKITPLGVVTTVVGTPGRVGFLPGVLPGVLRYPQGIALYGGTLYIADDNAIVKVTNVP